MSVLNKKCIPVIEGSEEFKIHFEKWNFFDYDKSLKSPILLRDPGQIFLFEKYARNPVEGGKSIYYPTLAVFLSYIPFDQTVEVEYSPIKRTSQLKENSYMLSSIISDLQWDDYHMIYGVWDSYPSWKELRRAYERTWWYYKTKSEKRDITINKILNG